ncbi:MAG: Fe-S cluster assembly protein SufD [Gammaproteobacteria bacterium]|nr:Fe-S cluster assembly protein SufD [Gammaproteobacteria bacterium]
MIAADQVQSWLDNQPVSLTDSAPSWLFDIRENALAEFEEIGLPSIRDEQWRYTNLKALKNRSFSPSTQTTLSIDIGTTNFPRLVFVDGLVDQDRSTALTELGVYNLAAYLQESPEKLEQHFGKTLPNRRHGFTALNSAYAQDGFVVELDKGQQLAQTIEVVFVSQTPESVSHTRNLIIAPANSQCTIIERHIGQSGEIYLSNHITEIIAGDNAHVDHYKIQQGSDQSFHFGGVFIKQGRHSNVKNHNINLSGLLTRNDINSDLLGEGAHVEMNGLVLGKGHQHVDNHTEVNHAVPLCTSDEYYKTVLDEHARSVFRGRIIVAEDAQQTLADQQNNNLLLSKKAEADTKPQLEIYADDVKCSHGATVGQLDETSLFYLKSRGIDNESARGLLTFAFANEVVDRIQIDAIKQELTKIIAGELLSGIEEML